MDNEAPSTEIVNVSTPLSPDAAAAMLTRMQGVDVPRAPGGQFASRQPVEVPEPDAPVVDDKVVDLKTKQPVKAEEPAPEEDEYFEFPAEKDGEEPRRVKIDEVLAAYEELPKLKGELENVRKTAPPPVDYVSGLQETVRARSQMMQGLEMLANALAPKDPPLDMLNPQSDKYNPEAYYDAKTAADKARADIRAINAEREKHQKAFEQEQEVITRAHQARETAALLQAWPEFAKEETKRELAESMRKTYGFTDNEINGIGDHRQMLVIRDALELRALKAKQAEAVQVVRQKPKLVKGAARTTTDSKTAARSAAMDRLRSTGSMDAAAEALKGLI